MRDLAHRSNPVALLLDEVIRARPNPDHKRAPLLVATASGRALKTEADVRARAATDALLQHVDAADCLRMAAELRRLRGALEAYTRAGS